MAGMMCGTKVALSNEKIMHANLDPRQEKWIVLMVLTWMDAFEVLHKMQTRHSNFGHTNYFRNIWRYRKEKSCRNVILLDVCGLYDGVINHEGHLQFWKNASATGRWTLRIPKNRQGHLRWVRRRTLGSANPQRLRDGMAMTMVNCWKELRQSTGDDRVHNSVTKDYTPPPTGNEPQPNVCPGLMWMRNSCWMISYCLRFLIMWVCPNRILHSSEC